MNNIKVYLLVPEGLTNDQLTEEQQTAVNMVLGEYQEHMTGTIPYNGQQVAQALCSAGFDPSLMPDYGIDWPIIGMWYWDGRSDTQETLVELDRDEWLNYLPDICEYDDEGNVISSSPLVFKIPSNWGGWPEIV